MGKDGNILTEQDEIQGAAVEYFEALLTQEAVHKDEALLGCIPHLISQGENEMLTLVPTREEVKSAAFSLKSNSAAGPDGFSGVFFQSCWNIIGQDVLEAVIAFFRGMSFPRAVSSTLLILVPKIPILFPFLIFVL